MRILHTADWHIGQRLYERPRLDEHGEFLEWLLKTIKCEKVELLLVSGDIFDTSLPSADAQSLYYEFLHRFSKETEAYAVITAGNHDSPRYLEAPKELLKMVRVYVVGRAANPNDCVLKFPPDDPKVSIAAVPYLSESELPHISFESQIKRAERYRERMKALYQQCVDAMPAELPKILMGHLFVQNGKESDSERNIQIGGATAIRVDDFPCGVDYVALGHLHRPQSINGASYPVRYSGSPLPLRFNEATYRKTVCLLEVSGAGNSSLVEEVEVKVFKELCTVAGDRESVLTRAREEEWQDKFIQVKLTLDKPEIGIGDRVRKEFQKRGGDVLNVEVKVPNGNGSKPPPGEMRPPTEMFEMFYRQENSGENPGEQLRQTFDELLELAQQLNNTGENNDKPDEQDKTPDNTAGNNPS